MKSRVLSLFIIAVFLLSGCSFIHTFRENSEKNQVEKSRVWISDYTGDTIYQVDTLTGRLVGKIKVSGGPTGMAVHPDGNTVYAACSKAGEVAVITNNRVISRIKVGESPMGLALNTNAGILVVSLSDENKAAVIDLETLTVRGKIPVGINPFAVAELTTTGLFAVSNNGEDTISIIDVSSMKQFKKIKVGLSPYGILVNRPKHKIYAACFEKNILSIIDTYDWKLKGEVPSGGGPYGVARGRGQLILVTGNSEGTISVIDPVNFKELKKIKVGIMPCGIEISPGGKYIMVVCEGDKKLVCLSSADYSKLWERPLAGTPRGIVIVRRQK